MSLTFNSVDPRTGADGPSFEQARAEDVGAAVAAATAAAAALRDRSKRIELLRGAAARLRAAGEEIVAVCEAETGLPEGRLRGELERTAGQLELFANVVAAGDHVEAIIDRADPEAKPIPRPDIRRMLLPLGPVAVFGASNFPLAFSTAGGDTASALAAGCPVVAKGHPSHPGTGVLVARELRAAAAQAGLPDGTFSHLLAAGVEVGQALVDDPGIAAVGFTGSIAGGRAIVDRAGRRPVPIPVYAEMGSVNPIVVTEAALGARAGAIAAGLTASVSSFGGQLCTKPGILFVPKGEAGDAFAADVASRLDEVEPTVLLNRGVGETLRGRLERLTGLDEVEVLTTAEDAAGPGFRHQPAAYRAPAAAAADGSPLLDEHFGPVVLFLTYGSTAELTAALDQLDGQLTATLHAQPGEDVAALVEAMTARAGRVIFDGFPTGVAVIHAMHHGGPYPACSNPLHTSVGATAIRRWQRPVAFQDLPAQLLPAELQDENPLGIWRRVDSVLSQAAL